MSPSPGVGKFDGRHHRAPRRRRDGADRRTRRAPHERRHLRHHGRARSASSPSWSTRSRTTASSAPDAVLAQPASSTSARSSALLASLDAPPPSWDLMRAREADDQRALVTARPPGGSRGAGIHARHCAPALGGLPDPGLPQDPQRGAHASLGAHLRASRAVPTGRALARLGGASGRPPRPHRRRYRHLDRPHRRHPHLDLCLASRRLARRCRPLAGARARHRGPAVRRAARAPDAALRRPPLDQARAPARRRRGPAGRCHARRRCAGRGRVRRPHRGLPFRARRHRRRRRCPRSPDRGEPRAARRHGGARQALRRRARQGVRARRRQRAHVARRRGRPARRRASSSDPGRRHSAQRSARPRPARAGAPPARLAGSSPS